MRNWIEDGLLQRVGPDIGGGRFAVDGDVDAPGRLVHFDLDAAGGFHGGPPPHPPVRITAQAQRYGTTPLCIPFTLACKVLHTCPPNSPFAAATIAARDGSCAACRAGTGRQAEIRRRTRRPANGAWTPPLFDGSPLDGWRGYKRRTPPAPAGRSREGMLTLPKQRRQGHPGARDLISHRHLRPVRARVGLARRGGREQRPEILRPGGHGLGVSGTSTR